MLASGAGEGARPTYVGVRFVGFAGLLRNELGVLAARSLSVMVNFRLVVAYTWVETPDT
jgi:hypothetical protein